ncbi:hypothetical protein MKX50_24725 [Paenibacillus sp. FSL W8-0186]|uniref:hypothetical protein n=1 Tax=Paenibacillus sp. FSL W8-0186 TaxID=2921709 RepID=UPI0030D55116
MEQEQFVHIYDQREIICSETGKKEVAEMCEDEGGYMWENVLDVVVIYGYSCF